MSSDKISDIEKEGPVVAELNHEAGQKESSWYHELGYATEPQAAELGRFQKYLQLMRVEQRGAERVPEEARTDQGALSSFTLWASANFTPSTVATGALAPIFGLGFWDSFAVIILVNVFASTLVGLTACYGPLTGLRMMSIQRFTFGIWGTRILILISLCSMIGWAAVNSAAGAELMTGLSDGKCPLWAGNVVIGVCTMLISALGYKALHTFERYCWIPNLIVFCFLAGYGAKSFDASALPAGSGAGEAQGVLSYMAVIFGFVGGWALLAGDYNVCMRRDCNKPKLIFATWAGNVLGCCATQILGMALMTAAAADATYADAYDASGVGGLMSVALKPLHGFGQFLLVISALSIVGCNLVNMYSFAFQVQNFHPVMLKVPRFAISAVGSAIALGISIPAATSFDEVLEDFLAVIAYTLTPVLACLAVEHWHFRRGSYPLERWNDPAVLPVGYAGVTAIIFGFVGAILTMDQAWYVGVVAKAIKPYGAEMGWIFSGLFAVLSFVPARYLELKYTGK